MLDAIDFPLSLPSPDDVDCFACVVCGAECAEWEVCQVAGESCCVGACEWARRTQMYRAETGFVLGAILETAIGELRKIDGKHKGSWDENNPGHPYVLLEAVGQYVEAFGQGRDSGFRLGLQLSFEELNALQGDLEAAAGLAGSLETVTQADPLKAQFWARERRRFEHRFDRIRDCAYRTMNGADTPAREEAA